MLIKIIIIKKKRELITFIKTDIIISRASWDIIVYVVNIIIEHDKKIKIKILRYSRLRCKYLVPIDMPTDKVYIFFIAIFFSFLWGEICE